MATSVGAGLEACPKSDRFKNLSLHMIIPDLAMTVVTGRRCPAPFSQQLYSVIKNTERCRCREKLLQNSSHALYRLNLLPTVNI
jgi:hypothetical protein